MSLTPKLLQQGAAGSARANYIEDVFSTYLYTGNAGVQTINNGIDLATKGGLVWNKSRVNAYYHNLYDTARGVNNRLFSNTTDAATPQSETLTSFNSNGFTLGQYDTGQFAGVNSGVSWTFREQPKFFDIVTWTGNGTTQNLSHNLGSIPGMIIIKRIGQVGDWNVWHRSLTAGNYIKLNTTAAQTTGGAANYFGDNSTTVNPTSTTFTVGNNSQVNADSGEAGNTYVAYLFAHNAGGFGLTGTDNVISCGSFTVDGSGNATVSLGYEPQWVMVKASSTTSNWEIYDSMRGLTATSASARLYPNLTSVEGSTSSTVNATSTGFTVGGNMGAGLGGVTYIYIAIRLGPMKVPTTGTSVFSVTYRTGLGSSPTTVSAGFRPDFAFSNNTDATSNGQKVWYDRLRGDNKNLLSATTAAEADDGANGLFFTKQSNAVTLIGGNAYTLSPGNETPYINYLMLRAPKFFDEVCYTGDGTNGKAYNHNLTVVPELVIVKARSGSSNWKVLVQSVMRVLTLNTTDAYETADNTRYYFGNDTINISPTTTQLTVSNGGSLNSSSIPYVAYLFATCPGVSKVGSYTGNGSTQTIDCGFAAGARFILIKRTDSTGEWYVFDTARGIVSGNDPFLRLNRSTGEIVPYDAVDPANSGFIVNNDDTNFPINVASATYIFLAIA